MQYGHALAMHSNTMKDRPWDVTSVLVGISFVLALIWYVSYLFITCIYFSDTFSMRYDREHWSVIFMSFGSPILLFTTLCRSFTVSPSVVVVRVLILFKAVMKLQMRWKNHIRCGGTPSYLYYVSLLSGYDPNSILQSM